MGEVQETRFDQVYAQITKLEAGGKKEEAKSLLKSFLEVAEESKGIDRQPKKPAVRRDIKIKTRRACLIDGKIIPEGKEVMVSKEEAEEFCDRGFDAYHPFYGYAPELSGSMDADGKPVDRHMQRQRIVRAERVA